MTASATGGAPGGMSGSFSLLCLPSDILFTVLQESESIGARELCRLEATCTTLRSMIDDTVWRGAFLHHRRVNALREPDCWKQEFARRDAWSRSWRQLVACNHQMSSSNMRLAGHTQKLRRFAMKMMAGAVSLSPTVPTSVNTLIVDPRGAHPGAFPTIGAALARAKPFDVVMIESGTYHECLRLEKPVEMIGLGPLGETVIVGTDGPTIEAASRIACRLARINIQQRAQTDGGAMSGAILIKNGALLIVEVRVHSRAHTMERRCDRGRRPSPISPPHIAPSREHPLPPCAHRRAHFATSLAAHATPRASPHERSLHWHPCTL